MWVLEKLKQANIETWLVINKVDNVKDKEALLPHLEWLGNQYSFDKIMPISAKQGKGVEELRNMVRESMEEHLTELVIHQMF